MPAHGSFSLPTGNRSFGPRANAPKDRHGASRPWSPFTPTGRRRLTKIDASGSAALARAPHSAATHTVAGSNLAAQNLNSGYVTNGRGAGLVRRLAAASTNAKGMNTTPSGMASS